ncbi:uncharacterized protein KY384_009073 [Bacidia gigantensis]|uniref:uncharacterized protein n=1 Tax=Bacidia gigantensis TaxID=2732470 RepID=UPI001D03F3E7|nr:uncharacterized protein KY384_009073 [Bacidia gigantensis]KAG8525429.1 hypothetical protein KY384_009073 [Bacidia gigantensis]
MPGSFAAAILFPESESAIVVLTNTTPLCDWTDWTTQLLTQTLFDFPEKVDSVSWMKRTAEAELGWHARIAADIRNEKGFEPPSQKLETIAQHGDKLVLLFGGRQDELFPMEHVSGDTFSWLQSRNELVSRGRVVLQPATYYMIRFGNDESEGIHRFFWTHDTEIPRGEEYIKVAEKQQVQNLIHEEL